MENFERIGPSPFRPGGTTKTTGIHFDGGSKLKVYGGHPHTNFRLKFSNEANEGWWVGPRSIDQLIVELLYIRKDMNRLTAGADLDIEVGRAVADEWGGPVEIAEEEEDEAPY